MAQTPTESTKRMDDSRKAFLAERAAKITAAMDRAAHAQRYLANTVANAHDAGMTWGEIGTMLGCSKQAAQQRFGTKPADD